MLDKVRSNIESNFVRVIIIVVVAAFIGTIFLVWGHGGKSEHNEQVIARVYDIDITYPEFREEYLSLIKQYRNIYRDRWSEDMIKKLDIKKHALDNIINQYVLLHTARDWNIKVSHEQVMEHIRSLPIFKSNGVFNEDIYQQRLSMAQITPQKLEHDIYRFLIYDKVKERIAGGYKVTDIEALKDYKEANEKIKAEYLLVSNDRFMPDIKVSLDELKGYFEAHKDKYLFPERRSVEYLLFRPMDYEQDANVSDTEINLYYTQNERLYDVPKQVKARHILLKVQEGTSEEDEERIRKKANDLLEKIKAGEDFAELAEKNSDCPSAIKGGDLGYFGKGKMDPVFEKAAFSLDIGQVSDVIKSSFGYHIIKVDDIKPEHIRPLSEVRNEIIKTLKKEKSKTLALNRAEDVIREIYHGKFLRDFALEDNVVYQEAGPFPYDEVVPGLGRNKAVMDEIFSLDEGKVSKIVDSSKGFFIFRLLKIEEPREADYDEVETKVEIDAKLEKVKKKTKEVAEKVRERLIAGEKIKDIADEYKFTVTNSGEFKRDGYITGLGQLTNTQTDELFSLDQNQISPAFETQNGYALFKIEEKTGINQEEFEKQREQLKAEILKRKETELFNTWMERMKKIANLEILNEDFIS